LLASLRGRGIRLWLDEQFSGLVPRLSPTSLLTSLDREHLAAVRGCVIGCLLAEAREAAERAENAPGAWRSRFRWPEQAADSPDAGSYLEAT
jgi:hypothetical protein